MAEGRHKEILADNEDQRNGPHTDEVLNGILMADDHVAGNGVEQHLQHAAGAVLGKHLDKLYADDNIQRPFKEGMHLHTVGIGQKPRHEPEQRYNAHQQGNQHNA